MTPTMDTAAAERRAAVLRERARVLAAPVEQTEAARDSFEVLLFRLAGGEYAVRTAFVVEVLVPREVTPLPGTPAFVLGIINVRGQIFSVINPLRFLGLAGQTDGAGKLIILRAGAMELSVMVDEIIGVRTIAAADIQAGAGTFRSDHSAAFAGVTANGVAVLDAGALLADERLIVDDAVE